MAESHPRLYEGLFLINQQEMGGDLQAALDHVREMLDRAGAEVLSLRKWEERKLAYPVKGQKRGVYLLSLFKVPPFQIANIERDCNHSDQVLRVLMVAAEHIGEAEIEREQNEARGTADEAKLKAEGEDQNTSEGEGNETPQAQEAAS